jgi:DNA-binding NtrC family response regulator
MDKVLIIEDDPVVGRALEENFVRRKLAATRVDSLAQASSALDEERFDLVMLDLRLPDGNGEEFLEQIMALPESPLVVMVTGNGTIESAVTCMRLGAFDYLLKPFSNSQIDVILRKATSHRQLVQVSNYLSAADDENTSLVGRSPAMMRLRQLIARVAPTDATVLIAGESGTGKEMIARELFLRSSRRDKPFIKVNCAAVSQTLIESEFFGHERGAYTGATQRREGRFELANHGTLMLDEISEIPLNLQAKLLRVLQEREFERVGGNRTIKVDVRIVATSNRDMLRHVEEGEFRKDLYYRLNVFPIQVPPLRERRQDIPLLAEHFLRGFVRKHGVKVTGFSDTARHAMLSYNWPGNVRELQNTVERAVILSESGRPVSAGLLSFSDNPADLTTEGAEIDWNGEESVGDETWEEPAAAVGVSVSGESGVKSIAELEKDAIRTALQQTGGNRTQASEILGISVRTLRNKLREYLTSGDPVVVEVGSGKD